MSQRKFSMTAILLLVLLIAACKRSLSEPLATTLPETPVSSATITPLPSATPISTSVAQAATSTVTPTLQPPDPTSTPTFTPPSPTSTPVPGFGTLGEIWNLADVRYGVHEDRVRVVFEMVEDRDTVPYTELVQVYNDAVPFPSGHDPSWGVARIDVVISDLYAYDAPTIANLPVSLPTNPVVTKIGQYPTFDDARFGFSIGLKTSTLIEIFELTHPVRIVIDILHPLTSILPTPIPDEVTWQRFTNEIYAVSLQYPSHWQVDPGFSTPGQGDISYKGADGFFIVNAADADSIDAFTASEANHRLQPYGSDPTVETLVIQGQEARMILPSEDQSMMEQAALVVTYPQPVLIGGHDLTLFVLYADKDYISDIAESVVFVTE